MTARSKNKQYFSINDQNNLIDEDYEEEAAEPLHHYQSFTGNSSSKKYDETKRRGSYLGFLWSNIQGKKEKIDDEGYPARRYPRIIDRVDELFSQSAGKTYLAKVMNFQEKSSLYRMDWFHSLLDAPTYRIMLILMSVYVGITLIFGTCYYLISEFEIGSCNLNFPNFIDSFIFSLETMATIGYSAPSPKGDIYFDSCTSVTIVLTLQCCIRLIVEAGTIGIVYSRLSRPASRASTIIFSDKAVIRRIRGRLYFMFQLCELRKHQLVEAHIRLYVVKHEVDLSTISSSVQTNIANHQNMDELDELCDGRVSSNCSVASSPNNTSTLAGDYKPFIQTNRHIFIQTCTMRLNHPNDELGGMLLLMLPQVVVHEIDITSPLMPPPVWISARTGEIIRWNPPVYRTLRRRKADYGRTRYHQQTTYDNNPMDSSFSRLTVDNSKDIPSQQQHDYPSKEQSHHQIGGESIFEEENGPYDESDEYDLYDAEALSNIEFPNVLRRGVEIYANSPPPYQVGGPSPIPSVIGNKPIIPRSPPPSNDRRQLPSSAQRKASGIPPKSLTDQLNLNAPIPLTPQKMAARNLFGQQQHNAPSSRPPSSQPTIDRVISSNTLNASAHVDLESPGLQKYHSDLNIISTLNNVSGYNSRDNSGAYFRNNTANINTNNNPSNNNNTNNLTKRGSNSNLKMLPPSGSNVNNNDSNKTNPANSGNNSNNNSGKYSSSAVPASHQPIQPMNFSSSKTTNNNRQDDSMINHASHSPFPVSYQNGPVPPTQQRPGQGQGQGQRQPSSASAVGRDQQDQYMQTEMILDEDDEPDWQADEKSMIQRYLLDRRIEIIAVVEGVDATTGGNLQARHSYTCDDIEWDKTFANCIFQQNGYDSSESKMMVDFGYFHKLRNAPKDAAYPGPIASNV